MIELGARSGHRRSSLIRLVARRPARAALAALLLAAGAGLAAPPPSAADVGAPPNHRETAAAALAPWTGGINLYRDGVFTTQASWLYCTAADIQIIRNMIEGTEDHSSTAQTAYFDWMRTKNRYDLPLSAGIDPAGWTAGMRHFVDDRYRLVSSDSFGYSLQLAVTRMRLTGRPVALAVAHGNHGWILHGFTATADPALTSDFEVLTISVTGPLWGLQSKNGYDMAPNTTLTIDELRTFFTRWHYDPLPMVWDGTFVSIQPLTDDELAAATPTPTPTPAPAPAAPPTPTPRATPRPSPAATAAPTPPPTVQATASPASPTTPTATASPNAPIATASSTPDPRLGAVGPGVTPPGASESSSAVDASAARTTDPGLLAVAVLGFLAVLGSLAVTARRRLSP